MRIKMITPVHVKKADHNGVKGVVDVTYYKRCGLLWLKTEEVTRRAMSEYGHAWQWLDVDHSNLFHIGKIINCHLDQILNGQIIKVEL